MLSRGGFGIGAKDWGQMRCGRASNMETTNSTREDARMRKLAVVLVFLASSAANAEELSGQLYAMCTSKDEVATTACRFFIVGVVQGIGYGDSSVMGPDSHLRQRSTTHFCIPDDMRQSQMVSVFQNTVRLLVTKYPEDLKSPAVSIVDAAMDRAFPCAKSN